MAFTVGTDTWITVEEADGYLKYRMGTDEWFNLQAEGAPGTLSKESILGTACRELLNVPTLDISMSASGDNVKNAQAEMALFLTLHFDELDDRRAGIATGLNSFILGKRREDLRTFFIGVPDFILSMLQDYSIGNITVEMSGQYDI